MSVALLYIGSKTRVCSRVGLLPTASVGRRVGLWDDFWNFGYFIYIYIYIYDWSENISIEIFFYI